MYKLYTIITYYIRKQISFTFVFENRGGTYNMFIMMRSQITYTSRWSHINSSVQKVPDK